MLEIGATVVAEVRRVEPYGVYLEHAGHDILVLAPEVAWRPTQDLNAVVKLGDKRPVILLRYNYAKRAYAGSFRRLRPEENPYRHLSRLPPDELLTGKVATLAGGEWAVELPYGMRGYVRL